ncbi:hypothetical protein [Actinomadura rudentiformis]|uniref:Uncharacterized protein n=1 Tax=Actinomadura rudentiformis TaxID=359158 RepID=A0A6H9Z757_9ACTN|nr:hypothetical protein [Actinomadura rudentiformis]KAB2352166.1 hypothetical protein F8566_00085 [Actinomadura rudentiformis]
MLRTIEETDTELAALEDLGQSLARHGHLTMMVTAGTGPRLEVLHRTEPGRSGTIVCQRDADGTAWFWWTWADRIAPARDLDRAAALIDQSLQRASSVA